MKAVIMAGGKGTRIAKVVNDVPKPMIKLLGKPVLEYQIENLKRHKITDIILVIGHLGNVIKSYFEDGKNFGVNITYYEETQPLGTAGALFYLQDELTSPFILIYGDIFIDINFDKMINYYHSTNAEAVLFVHPNSHPYDSDAVITDNKGKIVRWLKKNMDRDFDYQNLVNAGVYILSHSVFSYTIKNQKIDLEQNILQEMIDNNKGVFAYKSTEYVKDMGTPERLKSVTNDLKNGVCSSRNLSNRQKCVFLDRDGTINIHKGFINDSNDIELIKDASNAIKLLNKSGYICIVVTNQPVIARGECTIQELNKIHNRIEVLLGYEGVYLDDIIFCPHHPDKGFEGENLDFKIDCNCRKPKTGMIKSATEKYNIDISESWIIGDTTSDIKTGNNAGLKTILIKTGEAGKDGKYSVKPTMVADNIFEAVKMILGGKND